MSDGNIKPYKLKYEFDQSKKIDIKTLNGDEKAIADSADLNNNKIIDNDMELSIFNNTLSSLGLQDNTYEHPTDDTLTRNASLIMVNNKFDHGNPKKIDGNDVSNADTLQKAEDDWQKALKEAFSQVKDNPEKKAKLMDLLKSKPKIAGKNNLAEYTLELGRQTEKLYNIMQENTNELIKQNGEKLDELNQKLYDLQNALDEGKAEITEQIETSNGEVIATIRSVGADNKQHFDKVILNSKKQIVGTVKSNRPININNHNVSISDSSNINVNTGNISGRATIGNNNNNVKTVNNNNSNNHIRNG